MNTTKRISRPKKPTVYILPIDLVDEIAHEAIDRRMRKAEIVETACRQYLRESKRRPSAAAQKSV